MFRFLLTLAAIAGGLAVSRTSARGEPAAVPANSSQLAQPEREQPGVEITADAMRRHVEVLASPRFEGRGTPRGKQLARDYIVRAFRDLKLEPLFDQSYGQEIPGKRQEDGTQPSLGTNLGALLPGRDPDLAREYVIISAHYDHLGIRGGAIFHGADDNAGSVAMLLETARALATAPQRPSRSIIFLSCDLEEQMLWGARWFVAHPPVPLRQVRLFITSEMIGRTLGDLPLATIFSLGSEHATGLTQIVDAQPMPDSVKVAHLGIDLIGTRSDYGPFWGEKVPFVFFSGGEHPDYHRPTDTADRLDYDRAAAVARLILGVCRDVAETETPPVWTDTPERDLGEVRTLHQITRLLLDADEGSRAAGKPRLSDLQRFTVSNVHARTAQIIDRGYVIPDERPWLVRSSQLLLLTVF